MYSQHRDISHLLYFNCDMSIEWDTHLDIYELETIANACMTDIDNNCTQHDSIWSEWEKDEPNS